MSEKTEEPTEKKLEDARDKGQSPKSADLTIAAVLVVSLVTLIGAGPLMLDRMANVVKAALNQGLRVQSNESALAIMTQFFYDGLAAAMPMVILSVLTAALTMMMQVGIHITGQPLTPKFDKLNPASGLKRIFSIRSLTELGKSLLKALVIGTIVWVLIRKLIPMEVGAAYLPLAGAAHAAWKSMIDLLAATCAAFIVIGPADFALQRYMFLRDQRMSKEDIKREYKESEGDPEIKGKRKQLAQELINSAPEKRVPGATAVITNPTHYAVAVLYDAEKAPVPMIVAKGVDEQAAVIRELARLHGVPTISNPPLARALHNVALDNPVPKALFEAVAAVLLWVEKLPRLGKDASATKRSS
ncbi:MAG TPA: type III secretion system export apparatus subunit SctU [Burkholderiaceae bacterium]|nr:type III secretion system export apparatus subunit SctU [Burkholderiaceae bacterium]